MTFTQENQTNLVQMVFTPITLEGVLNRLSTDGANYSYYDFDTVVEKVEDRLKLIVVIGKKSSRNLTAEEWKQRVMSVMDSSPLAQDEDFMSKCTLAVSWHGNPGIFNISPTNLFTSGIVADNN